MIKQGVGLRFFNTKLFINFQRKLKKYNVEYETDIDFVDDENGRVYWWELYYSADIPSKIEIKLMRFLKKAEKHYERKRYNKKALCKPK